MIEASRRWRAFLASQPGFEELGVLADRAVATVAMTIWERAEDSPVALARREGTAATGLLALVVAPGAGRGLAVLAHEGAP